ncbi:MAG TPA: HAMP domain-containing sensor histidine kinase, partial [Chitinophagaceae bacterium]|nr:HAMP domain-containing sensor histidine kinase [Chitinophagaceae bacterium]
TATIVVFLLGSIFFFFVLQYILINELDETLMSERQEITKYVDAHNRLPEIVNTKEQWTYYHTVPKPIAQPYFKNSYINDEHEKGPIRQYFFSLKAGNTFYTITINKSQAETEDLLQIIILATVTMIAIILLINFIINRRVLNRLWNPFYSTIQNIKAYRLSDKQPLQLDKTSIDEFASLNESLSEMSARIFNDYEALKKFTENASHEMQTPLAVIRSKTDVLLQSTEWKEKEMQQLQQIEDATQKLAKLHQSLLLLTKLENRQFVLNEEVNLTDIIKQKINEREDLFEAKKISLHTNLRKVKLSFHQHLAEILVSNLLNNAIRHTAANGEIDIELSNEIFFVTNTASSGGLDKNKIFQRFYKATDAADGTGLGLAIVKEICNIANADIQYQYQNNKHQFIIRFGNENNG